MTSFLEKLFISEIKLNIDIRLKFFNFKSYGYTLYLINKNKYYQNFSYLTDLYHLGIELIENLQKYELITNDKKIHKGLNLFINHFNTVSTSLHLITTNGQLNLPQSNKLFKEINRSIKLLEKIITNLPNPSNIICKTVLWLGIGYVIGQFIQFSSILSSLVE